MFLTKRKHADNSADAAAAGDTSAADFDEDADDRDNAYEDANVDFPRLHTYTPARAQSRIRTGRTRLHGQRATHRIQSR